MVRFLSSSIRSVCVVTPFVNCDYFVKNTRSRSLLTYSKDKLGLSEPVVVEEMREQKGQTCAEVGAAGQVSGQGKEIKADAGAAPGRKVLVPH